MNTAQQTSLSITLREFEVRLARLRVLLEQNESTTRLTPARVDHLRQIIDRQQAMIDDLFRRFQLKRETIDAVQSMIAELSISWTQLVDSRSDKLNRFGEVNPDLKVTLDPAIDQMIDACLNMIRLLEKTHIDRPLLSDALG